MNGIKDILLEKEFKELIKKYALTDRSRPGRKAMAEILDIELDALKYENLRNKNGVPYSGIVVVHVSDYFVSRDPDLKEERISRLKIFAEKRGWIYKGTENRDASS